VLKPIPIVILTTVVLLGMTCRGGEDSSQPVETVSEDTGKQRIQDFWSLNREANRLRLAGDYETAAETFRRCLEINAEHEDSLYYLGASLEGLGDYSEAASAYRRMIALNPRSNRATSQLAHILATPAPGAAQNLAEAQELLASSIELNREHSGPYLRLGELFLDAGRPEEALGAFETAASFGSAEGIFLTGYAQLLLGRTATAKELFQKVLEAEEHERKLAARGGKQEGDTGANAPLSPLQFAALRSRLFLGSIEEQAPGPWDDHAKRASLAPDGGRASWTDFDLDGDMDAVVVGPGPVRLYRNEPGRFVDIASAAGVEAGTGFWDSCWGDYDSDGDPDLYLVASGHSGQGSNSLFENRGDGLFRESASASASSLSSARSTARAAFADFDGDGRPELIEAGSADEKFGALRLFRYQGEGWEDLSTEWGLEAPGTLVDFALADYDSDGFLDVYAALWNKPPVLYRNEGEGRFKNVTEAAGLSGFREQGFSAAFFDFDRDGAPDLIHTRHAPFAQVATFLEEPSVPATESAPHLFRNVGNGQFEQVSLEGDFAALARPQGTMQVTPADVDGDGWPDLVFANGGLGGDRVEPSVFLRNREGRGFESLGHSALANSQGASVVDADGDGQAEIYLGGNPVFRDSPFAGGLLLHRRTGGEQ